MNQKFLIHILHLRNYDNLNIEIRLDAGEISLKFLTTFECCPDVVWMAY